MVGIQYGGIMEVYSIRRGNSLFYCDRKSFLLGDIKEFLQELVSFDESNEWWRW